MLPPFGAEAENKNIYNLNYDIIRRLLEGSPYFINVSVNLTSFVLMQTLLNDQQQLLCGLHQNETLG